MLLTLLYCVDMFEINDRETRKFERILEKTSKVAVPFAVRTTLNSLAFDSRTEMQGNIREDMINRNQFTARSLQVEKAKGLNVNSMQSIMGSIASYMETQEFGGVVKKDGKQGQPIATSVSTGASRNAEPRRKLPQKINRLAAINLNKSKRKGKTRGQRNMIAVRQAAASSRKYIYMETGRSKGIFRIFGSSTNPRVEMMHDLSRSNYRIPKRPTMKPAVDVSIMKTEMFYKRALVFQLRKNGFK